MEKTKKKKMKDREMIKNDRYPKKKKHIILFRLWLHQSPNLNI